MKISFTGDLFLGGDLTNYKSSPFEMKSIISSDLIISNLESPITDIKETIKSSCTLYAPTKTINHLKKFNINIVCLANNHIHDKGKEGFFDTIKILKENNISYFGAGKNLSEAQKGIKLTNELIVFGFCEKSKYMKNIKTATITDYGVNPLTEENIQHCLKTLNKNQKAILYFHWGREHVYFPPIKNIILAKKLLKNDKVHSIIGNHSHLAQGYIKHNNKIAYFSLGNFLFPNFYLKPRNHITYPENNKTNKKTKSTTLYYKVSELTYKKWKKKNRRSIIITLDTTTNTFKHELTLQDSNKPILKKIKPRFSIKILNYIYTLNHHVYKFVFNILFNSYFYFIAIKYPQIMYHFFVYKKFKSNVKRIKNSKNK